MPDISGTAGTGHFMTGIIRMMLEEMLVPLIQRLTPGRREAGQSLPGGEAGETRIGRQMTQCVFTTSHDYLLRLFKRIDTFMIMNTCDK